MHVPIRTLRDLAARAGFDASKMKTPAEIRKGFTELEAKYPGLCDQHTCNLDDFLKRAGA